MIRYSFTLALVSIGIIAHVATAGELQVEPDKENVVASRLEGTWQVHESLTQRLTGEPKTHPLKISFESDPSVAAKVPSNYVKFFKEQNMKVYLAGHVELDDKRCPFVVTHIHGNPHVMFWLERNGDPFGNGESFNVMLAVAENRQSDLLFVGGDFNNQPFSAFEREKVDSTK